MPGKRHPRVHNLCLLGFGNVNRTLVRLLQDRELELRDKHGIAWRITGVATRRLGWIASRDGLDALLLAGNSAPRWDLLPHVSSKRIVDWGSDARLPRTGRQRATGSTRRTLTSCSRQPC